MEENKILEAIDKKFEELAQKSISNENLESLKSGLMDEVNTQFEKYSEASKEEITRIKEYAESLAEQIELMKNSVSEKAGNVTIAEFIVKAFNSERFAEFAESKDPKKAANFEQKDFSVSVSRTGEVMVTENLAKIVSEYGRRRLHVRDILNINTTTSVNVVYDKVTSVTQYATMEGENDELSQSAMTTAEQTDSVKRLGVYDHISRRAIKSANWATNRYAFLMEKSVLYKEDFELLYGDGAGNEVGGLAGEARQLVMAGASFVATSIASVASYNSGTKALLTFAAAHNLINGYNITIANATEATYNATFAVNVVSDTQILLDVTYVAEADTSAWTATTTYYLTDLVQAPKTVDAVIAGLSLMKSYDNEVTGILMNPADAAMVAVDKGTDGHPTANGYIYSVERIGMNLFIGGIPVIEMNAVKAGTVFFGEFTPDNIEMWEYTPLNIEVSSDAELVRKNKIQFAASEEILFSIYNPFAFGFMNIATVKAELAA